MSDQMEPLFVQEVGWVRTSFGSALYIRIRSEDYRVSSWTEIWETYNDLYPDQWAVQFFPPTKDLLDEANIYHLYVLSDPPGGINICRSDLSYL